MLIDKTTAALWEWQGRNSLSRTWTRTNIEEAVERVNKGAMLLDEKNPGWVGKIVPDNLEMANSSFCIIGQAYGDYAESVAVAFGFEYLNNEYSDPDNPDSYEEAAIEHGFLTYQREGDVPYTLLDRVWVYLLQARAGGSQKMTLGLYPPEPQNVQFARLQEADLFDISAKTA